MAPRLNLRDRIPQTPLPFLGLGWVGREAEEQKTLPHAPFKGSKDLEPRVRKLSDYRRRSVEGERFPRSHGKLKTGFRLESRLAGGLALGSGDHFQAKRAVAGVRTRTWGWRLLWERAAREGP